MNNYTLSHTPATLSAATMLLAGCAAAFAAPQIGAMERAEASARMAITRSTSHILGARLSPTLGVNLHKTSYVEAGRLFASASEAFAVKLSSGVEPLGSEFAAVIEEDFWDLVLR